MQGWPSEESIHLPGSKSSPPTTDHDTLTPHTRPIDVSSAAYLLHFHVPPTHRQWSSGCSPASHRRPISEPPTVPPAAHAPRECLPRAPHVRSPCCRYILRPNDAPGVRAARPSGLGAVRGESRAFRLPVQRLCFNSSGIRFIC